MQRMRLDGSYRRGADEEIPTDDFISVDKGGEEREEVRGSDANEQNEQESLTESMP